MAALERYGVLTYGSHPALQALVDLAARMTGIAQAAINLITETEQVQVATTGFAGSTSPRGTAMCAQVVDAAEPIVVADASLEERFRDSPLVAGPAGVRFYASHPLTTPEGVVIGTLCVFDERAHPVGPDLVEGLRLLAERIVDVLELDLTTRRLTAANEQLAWANEALGAFAGQVSHDLKNPLAGVIMSLGLALEDLAPDHPARELIVRAGRSADRMSIMIGDLLDFAAGDVGTTRAPVDLAALVTEVADDLGPALTEAEVVLGDLPTVPADPGSLRVVVQNLLVNAAKFARPALPARIEVSGYRTDRFWRLEVADNGRGVPLEERTRVFEPLVRLDRRVPGTGIGMATCLRIVAAHGGTMGVSDGLPVAEGEQGITVWLEIPIG